MGVAVEVAAGVGWSVSPGVAVGTALALAVGVELGIGVALGVAVGRPAGAPAPTAAARSRPPARHDEPVPGTCRAVDSRRSTTARLLVPQRVLHTSAAAPLTCAAARLVPFSRL